MCIFISYRQVGYLAKEDYTYNDIVNQDERSNDNGLAYFESIDSCVYIDRVWAPYHKHSHPRIVEIGQIEEGRSNESLKD